MRRLAFLVAALCMAAALALGGSTPFGRLALAAGLPALAASIFTDAHWRGVALLRAGDPAAAVEALSVASEDARYDLGNALVATGNLAAALEAYDRAVAVDPDDLSARANFDRVATVYAGTLIDVDAVLGRVAPRQGATLAAPVGKGQGRAAGTGNEVTNSNASMGLPDLVSRGRLGVRRSFEDKALRADSRWLASLADVPGAYISARIAAEHKRREEAGLALPPPEDPR